MSCWKVIQRLDSSDFTAIPSHRHRVHQRRLKSAIYAPDPITYISLLLSFIGCCCWAPWDQQQVARETDAGVIRHEAWNFVVYAQEFKYPRPIYIGAVRWRRGSGNKFPKRMDDAGARTCVPTDEIPGRPERLVIMGLFSAVDVERFVRLT